MFGRTEQELTRMIYSLANPCGPLIRYSILSRPQWKAERNHRDQREPNTIAWSASSSPIPVRIPSRIGRGTHVFPQTSLFGISTTLAACDHVVSGVSGPPNASNGRESSSPAVRSASTSRNGVLRLRERKLDDDDSEASILIRVRVVLGTDAARFGGWRKDEDGEWDCELDLGGEWAQLRETKHVASGEVWGRSYWRLDPI
jgi:hypothetical protein